MRRIILMIVLTMCFLGGCQQASDIDGGSSMGFATFNDFQGFVALKDALKESYFTFEDEITLSLDGVNAFNVSSTFEKVKVIPEDRKDLEVRYYGIFPISMEEKSPSIDILKGKDAQVTIAWEKIEHPSHAILELHLPKDLAFDLGLKSLSGNVSVLGGNFSKLSVKTASGVIDINASKAENVVIDTMSGSVNMTRLSSETVQFNTMSGAVVLVGDHFEKITGQTMSGAIDLVANSLGESLDFETNSASVSVKLGEVKGTINASSQTGAIRLLTEEGEKTLSKVVTDAPVTMTIETQSGSISVTQ